jgi:hypothetical protein
MNFSQNRLILVVSLLLLPLFSWAQNSSASDGNYIVNSDSYTQVFQVDSLAIEAVTNEDLGSWEVTLEFGEYWILDFQSQNDVTGSSRVTLKVFESDSTGSYFYYKFITVNFEASFIQAHDDYLKFESDTSFMVLDLLTNDSSTADLFIKDFSLVKNGSIEFDTSGQVLFTPDSSFMGVAVVNYVACDTFNHCDNAEAYILVSDDQFASSDTVELFTVKNKKSTYLSPIEGIEITTAEHGELKVENDLAVVYFPMEDFTGVDTFDVFIDSSFYRMVIVHVLDLGQNNLFLKDDYVYANKNQSVMIDAFANDEPFLDLESFTNVDTGLLVFDTLAGKFNYAPPLDYEGPVSFSYTCTNGFETETAKVKILIKNIKPVLDYNYVFEGIENVPLLIRYNVPTADYTLNLWSDPEYGDVEVDEQGETFDEGCEPVTIQRELVYYPEDDWTGVDSFLVAHCLQGECTEIMVYVKMLPDDGDCHCMGDDCIWAGDANNDGVVNMLDLLTVGYFLGDITEGRIIEGTEWVGVNPEVNDVHENEYADTDGNGIVAVFDTTSISQNYYNTHEIVPDVLPLSDYSVDLVPETTVLDSGDLAVIHVELGDLDLPLYDVYGISFSLDFSEETIDSSSVGVEISANSWFLNFTRALDLTKVPWDGRVDVGFSRTNGVTADGYGLVSTLSFIVIDNVEGFRLRDDKLPITLRLNNIVVSHGDGSMSQLADVEKTIYVKVANGNEEPEIDTEENLILYPNPTDGLFNVHLNGQNEIKNIAIHTITGAQVLQIRDVQAEKKTIDLRGLQEGFYVVQVETDSGIVSKKLSIIK